MKYIREAYICCLNYITHKLQPLLHLSACANFVQVAAHVMLSVEFQKVFECFDVLLEVGCMPHALVIIIERRML